MQTPIRAATVRERLPMARAMSGIEGVNCDRSSHEENGDWNLSWRGTLRACSVPGRAGAHHAPGWRERRTVSQMAVDDTGAEEATGGDRAVPGGRGDRSAGGRRLQQLQARFPEVRRRRPQLRCAGQPLAAGLE